MRKTLYLLLILTGALSLLVLLGCREDRADQTIVIPPEDNAVRTVSDLAFELTYPQSDDQGHYVAITQPGEVIVEGIVSGPQRPRVIEVNGVPVRPYPVEYIQPYGARSDYPVYRFRAPIVMQPDQEIIVVAREPYDSVRYVYAPNTAATIDRWAVLSDRDPVYVSRLGRAYYANAAYSDAATHLERAAQRDDSPWALYDLGMTYLALDRADDAVITFDRVESRYAAMPDLYYGRGLTYSTMNRMDDAIVNYVRASDLAPDWAEPLVALGLSYYARDLLGDAVGPYDRAIAVLPEWAAPYYGLALVRLDQNRYDDGLVLLREAEQRGPWRARHHEELARKLAAKGNYNAARRQLEIARKLGGSRVGWWTEIERKAPNYRNFDGWPWRVIVTDDGYRIPEDSPWYEGSRKARRHVWETQDTRPRAVGGGDDRDRGGPPTDHGRSDNRGQGGNRGQGVGGGQSDNRGQGGNRGQGNDGARGNGGGQGNSNPGQSGNRGQGGGGNQGGNRGQGGDRGQGGNQGRGGGR